MRLYLVRHGEPVPKTVEPDQPLSDKGHQETHRMSRFLAGHSVRVGEIWHSGKTRASQTATIFFQTLSVNKQEFHGGLKPLDDVDPIISDIKNRSDDLIIVSHLPFLGVLASSLLTKSAAPEMFTLNPSSVVCLERSRNDAWTLLWLLSPEIV